MNFITYFLNKNKIILLQKRNKSSNFEIAISASALGIYRFPYCTIKGTEKACLLDKPSAVVGATQ